MDEYDTVYQVVKVFFKTIMRIKGLVTCQEQILACLKCVFKQETLPPKAGPALWSVHTSQTPLCCN